MTHPEDSRKRIQPARPKVECACQYCGVIFLAPPSKIERGLKKFCSRSCYVASMKGQPRAHSRTPIADRFWKRVDKSGECWMWTGVRLPKGYGYMRRGRASEGREYVHRIAWELATGETLGQEDVIGHTCDMPACVRNDDVGVYVVGGVALPRVGHLFKGTTADNIHDMWSKQRGPDTKGVVVGERHGSAKLTEEQVRLIRARAANGEANAALAREFGVSPVLIGRIVRRLAWVHVD